MKEHWKILGAYAFTYRGAFVPIIAVLAALAPSGHWQAAYGLWFAALVSLGAALRLSSVYFFPRARVHSAGARELITSGPFAYIRNPVYLGNLLCVAGMAGAFFGPIAALVAFSATWVFYAVVVSHEERLLLPQWGESYAAYCQAVPRWLPRLSTLVGEANATRLGACLEVARRERGFVIAVGFLLLLLTVRTLIPSFSETMDEFFSRQTNLLPILLLVAAFSQLIKVGFLLQRKRGSWRPSGNERTGPGPAHVQSDSGSKSG